MVGDDELDSLLGRMARDELPWERAWVAPYQEFADRFTLHDSFWIGTFLPLGTGDVAVMVFEWDAHWLPEPIRQLCIEGDPGPPRHGNPFLFIRLTEVSYLRLTGYQEKMEGRDISRVELRQRDRISGLDLIDSMGATLRVEYYGSTEFLALRSQDQQPLDLSQVELEPRRAEPSVEKPWWRLW